MTKTHRFYEFFAGGGMARQGLGKSWECLLANEWCPKKAAAYRRNHSGPDHLLVQDVALLKPSDIPERAHLAWASFPCQDLSLAGQGKGLSGKRSGTFHAFWKLMLGLRSEGRMPPVIALENVTGALTSNEGKDFETLARAFAEANYRFGALIVDAVHFVPQSRPRLFFIGVAEGIELEGLEGTMTHLDPMQDNRLHRAYAKLPSTLAKRWVWWKLPHPKIQSRRFSDLVDDSLPPNAWHQAAETHKLLGMMSAANLSKVEEVSKSGRLTQGTIYRRTRIEDGVRVQRAEARFDGISGCLRTPGGGSSRQIVIEIDGDRIRSRLLAAREAARLMGLPDSYQLPEAYNEAYHLLGDGLVVPVISHLSTNLLAPLAERSASMVLASAA
jgi:DNA (cytosine-5)-methyltransferase 1